MNAPLLSLDRVSVSYGKVPAVRDVSLTVEPAEIVTVIGANGAGKTTLLNAIMGILPAEGGIRFDGDDLAYADIEDRFDKGMGLVAERRHLFGGMSVEDNLRLGGFSARADAASAALRSVYERFPRLGERRRQLAGTLSGGERQMLAIGRALMVRPRLLMLDEPSLGLAPRIAADIFAIVAELRRDGVAVLLVEQNARAALALADRGYVMELGTTTLDGPAAMLASDERVAASYLGVS